MLDLILWFSYNVLRLLFPVVLFIFVAAVSARLYFEIKRRTAKSGVVSVAFFHPYCNAGGGGEKVLWHGVVALQKRYPKAEIYVYTGDTDAAPDEIESKALQRFNIELPRSVTFIYLNLRSLIEASKYPIFTLLGQSIGGFLLGLEALVRFRPDVYVDSMGYAFTIPLFRYVGGCRTAAYVHYPTISTDMLRMVAERRPAYNNADSVSRSRFLSCTKLIYYRLFAWIYGLAGRRTEAVMVNSTWTRDHIQNLWKCPSIAVVYPPCDVAAFERISSSECESHLRETVRVLTVAQFRPEKDHRKQINILAALKKTLPGNTWTKIKWIFVGGCRHQDDYDMVMELKTLANKNGVEENVEFKVNASFDELKRELGAALIGIHTMWNEHFGIGVVDCMAAGNIMIAHNSGGPKLDIVVPYNGETTGFLADTPEEYAKIISKIINMSPAEREKIRKAARASCDRFTEARFADGFAKALEQIF